MEPAMSIVAVNRELMTVDPNSITKTSLHRNSQCNYRKGVRCFISSWYLHKIITIGTSQAPWDSYSYWFFVVEMLWNSDKWWNTEFTRDQNVFEYGGLTASQQSSLSHICITSLLNNSVGSVIGNSFVELSPVYWFPNCIDSFASSDPSTWQNHSESWRGFKVAGNHRTTTRCGSSRRGGEFARRRQKHVFKYKWKWFIM